MHPSLGTALSGRENSLNEVRLDLATAVIIGMLGLGTLVPARVFSLVSFGATFPFAIASWRCIERPAMRARRTAPRGDLNPVDVMGPGPERTLAERDRQAHPLLVGGR